MNQLLPTELIGSYALPSWFWIVLERIEKAGDLGETDLSETLDDAVNIAILDQHRAGVDVVTDGEMRRRDFIQNFYRLLTGLIEIPPARAFGSAGYDQNPRYEVVDTISAPGGLGIVAEVEYLKEHTSVPFKVCVPGPITLSLPLLVKGGYDTQEEVLEDMVKIVNAEMKALTAAGAKYLQIDEPRYATTRADAQQLVAIFNATREGVAARIGLHLCFGNYKGRSRDRRDYQYLFPALEEAHCDQFNFEFANRQFAQVELLEKLPPSCKVGIGVVDVKSCFVETPAEVADAIRLAAKYVSAKRIVVTPDCGFNHCPRYIALAKLRSMVQGAAIVREELQG